MKDKADNVFQGLFPSAISRYLVSNIYRGDIVTHPHFQFPSAISRYLVSNRRCARTLSTRRICFHPLYRGTWFPTSRKTQPWRFRKVCFHPLYRGTWFPTVLENHFGWFGPFVSIRYIAVLGFQLWGEIDAKSAVKRFPSAISRYLVSNSARGL